MPRTPTAATLSRNISTRTGAVLPGNALTPLLLEWYRANARDLPWRRTRDPYAIWVSEIMLQQTQVKTVILYWERWMRELPTLRSLAQAPSERLHKLWEGLGYYTRVRNMQKAAQVIVAEHGGEFPSEFQQVLALPGIGRYTAGAICSIAYNQPAPILDGNVIRVATRVFGIAGDPKEKQTNAQLWELAQGLVNDAHSLECATLRRSRQKTFPHCSFLNQSLMELGALICTPKQPACQQCPLKSQCFAAREARVEEFPNSAERPTATQRRFVAFIVERDGKYLVQQRPTGVVNANLWEFPNFEILKTKLPEAASGFLRKDRKAMCTIRHSITRYRITLQAFRAELSPTVEPSGEWHTLRELDKLAFPSAHRKILKHLQQQVS